MGVSIDYHKVEYIENGKRVIKKCYDANSLYWAIKGVISNPNIKEDSLSITTLVK